MAHGTNIYNRLRGFILWITRSNVPEPEYVFISRDQKIKLPISGKEYKVTLRNIKLFLINELKTTDPSITEICVDEVRRVGILKWPEDQGPPLSKE